MFCIRFLVPTVVLLTPTGLKEPSTLLLNTTRKAHDPWCSRQTSLGDSSISLKNALTLLSVVVLDQYQQYPAAGACSLSIKPLFVPNSVGRYDILATRVVLTTRINQMTTNTRYE